MLSSVFVNVPAGVLGTGSVDARPESCAALLGAVSGVAGTPVLATGLPSAAGLPPIFRGWSGAGTAPALRMQHDQINKDGTTPLGNHSPGRPLS